MNAPAPSSRLRVLILLNSLAPYGAENFVLNHVRCADRRRFELVVAHLGGTDALGDRFREAGVEVIDLAAGSKRRFGPATFARLAWELRRRRIDLLQAHIGLSGVVGAVLGTLTRVPVVVTEQTTRSSYPSWFQRAADLTFRLPDHHVYISRAVADDFASAFPAAAAPDRTIIPNGIDVEAIARTAASGREAVRAELGLGPDDIAIGNIGRLAPQKGQRYLIEAFAAVRAKQPRTSLWIVGSGDLEAELRAQAEAAGVADAVHLLGQRMDVHRLLGGFDVYAHPALFEGLGIAVLEAMAASLPVVASSVDAIPEYVHDGETGLLAPPRDPTALAAAILRMVERREDAARIGAAGHALMERDFDIRAAVRAYEALYERLVGSGATR